MFNFDDITEKVKNSVIDGVHSPEFQEWGKKFKEELIAEILNEVNGIAQQVAERVCFHASLGKFIAPTGMMDEKGNVVVQYHKESHWKAFMAADSNFYDKVEEAERNAVAAQEAQS